MFPAISTIPFVWHTATQSPWLLQRSGFARIAFPLTRASVQFSGLASAHAPQPMQRLALITGMACPEPLCDGAFPAFVGDRSHTATGAPQELQNDPDTRLPHLGQVLTGAGVAGAGAPAWDQVTAGSDTSPPSRR